MAPSHSQLTVQPSSYYLLATRLIWWEQPHNHLLLNPPSRPMHDTTVLPSSRHNQTHTALPTQPFPVTSKIDQQQPPLKIVQQPPIIKIASIPNLHMPLWLILHPSLIPLPLTALGNPLLMLLLALRFLRSILLNRFYSTGENLLFTFQLGKFCPWLNHINYFLFCKFSFGRPPMDVIRKFFMYFEWKDNSQVFLLDNGHVNIKLEIEEDYLLQEIWFFKIIFFTTL